MRIILVAQVEKYSMVCSLLNLKWVDISVTFVFVLYVEIHSLPETNDYPLVEINLNCSWVVLRCEKEMLVFKYSAKAFVTREYLWVYVLRVAIENILH